MSYMHIYECNCRVGRQYKRGRVGERSPTLPLFCHDSQADWYLLPAGSAFDDVGFANTLFNGLQFSL